MSAVSEILRGCEMKEMILETGIDTRSFRLFYYLFIDFQIIVAYFCIRINEAIGLRIKIYFHNFTHL